jgi:DNA-binding NtrC family response regulator
MQPPVVAVINSTPDIVDMLRVTLEQAGFVVVTTQTHEIRDGHVEVEQFIGQHDPRVIVYDVAPPYEPNWQLFQHLAAMPVMQGRQFVVTSTNRRHVEGLAAPQHHVYEIVGKPFDLGQLVQAVKEAVRARPTR